VCCAAGIAHSACDDIKIAAVAGCGGFGPGLQVPGIGVGSHLPAAGVMYGDSPAGLQASLDHGMAAMAALCREPVVCFWASVVFGGRRLGYVFKTGSEGVGYYLDRHAGLVCSIRCFTDNWSSVHAQVAFSLIRTT
jgi:hypothetical protein